MPNPASSSHRGNWAGGAMTDADMFAALILLTLLAPAAVLALPRWRDHALRWLTDHHILVSATTHPLWTLPGNVAGLDTSRSILAIIALTSAIAALTSWAWHRYQRHLQTRLTAGDEQ